ncbi:arabinogalactan endo-1,4-beta-galactosidase [Hymenopellis radicata]|nr:arabinogalactan endo-1,4-beta-galactosidase [Hymenopellis radicata]
MFSLLSLVALLAPLTEVLAISYRGADISSLALLEEGGTTYSAGGSVEPLETILASYGANLARIRIWTDDASDYNLDYGLALAQRAANTGMAIMVDLHYSDTWADPANQAIPSAWATDLDSLNTQIYTYTLDVVQSFVDAGLAIDFIQVGNEINDGMLWPTGQISKNGYSPLSQLLHSAVSAVRSASSSTKTVIHIANGWYGEGVTSFYDQVFIQGALSADDVDVMGFSMYPFYDSGATLNALQSSLSSIVSSYSKDVMLVETDWPVECPGVNLTEDIPVSSTGQVTWVGDLVNILDGLSGGHGAGFVYWEPAWIGNAALGSGCSDNLLVEYSGAARTSMEMFAV